MTEKKPPRSLRELFFGKQEESLVKKIIDSSVKSSMIVTSLASKTEVCIKVLHSLVNSMQGLHNMVLEHEAVIKQFKSMNETMSKQMAKHQSDTYGFPAISDENEKDHGVN